MRPSALIVVLAIAVLSLSACTEVRRTAPERTANEQLLITTAATKAIDKMDFDYVDGRAVFLQTAHFESYDSGFVVASIREILLREGAHLVPGRKKAEVVIEIRAAALSINRKGELIGVPGFDLPVPAAGTFTTPEIALYSESDRTGIAKLAAVGMDAQSGELISAPGPVWGLSWLDRDAIVGLGWQDDNLTPPRVSDNPPPKTPE